MLCLIQVGLILCTRDMDSDGPKQELCKHKWQNVFFNTSDFLVANQHVICCKDTEIFFVFLTISNPQWATDTVSTYYMAC